MAGVVNQSNIDLYCLVAILIVVVLTTLRVRAQNAGSCDTTTSHFAARATQTSAAVTDSPGRFHFRATNPLPSTISMDAKIAPTSQPTNVTKLDLRRGLFQTNGAYTIDLDPSDTYTLQLVNGNAHNPLELTNLKGGIFEFGNDATILDKRTGKRYYLGTRNWPVLSHVDNQRQQTVAFTAAYRACPTQNVVSFPAWDDTSGLQPRVTLPTAGEFVGSNVSVGGPSIPGPQQTSEL